MRRCILVYCIPALVHFLHWFSMYLFTFIRYGYGCVAISCLFAFNFLVMMVFFYVLLFLFSLPYFFLYRVWWGCQMWIWSGRFNGIEGLSHRNEINASKNKTHSANGKVPKEAHYVCDLLLHFFCSVWKCEKIAAEMVVVAGHRVNGSP